MLDKIEVTNARGDMLTLTPPNPINGFIVAAINGLDPVKATLVSSGYAKMDGSKYQSSRRENRNILFSIKYNRFVAPVRELRTALYNYFMPKSSIDMTFYINDLVVNIDGVVESFETDLFSKEPAVVISVQCFDPDFKESTVTSVAGVTTAGTANQTIDYDGTVETGFVFTLNVDQAMTSFTLYNQSGADETESFEFAETLQAGDVIKISTVQGDKYATLTRGGITTSILYGVSPYASWLELRPGTNLFRVQSSTIDVPYTLDYTNRYGGL